MEHALDETTLIRLHFVLLSMSHDQNIFHAMLGQKYSEILISQLMVQSPLVLVLGIWALRSLFKR